MLVVEGDVVLETAGARLRLDALGSTIEARIQRADAVAILRRSRSTMSFFRLIVPFLVRGGMTVDVFAGTVRIARVGAGVNANLLGRMLDLSNVRIGN